MTVAPIVYDVLLYGSLAAAAGAVVVFYVRDGRPKLPAATVHGAPSRALCRWIARVAPWVALAVGGGGAVWLHTQSYAVVIVTDDGARSAIQLGHAPADVIGVSDRVWVVNRSKHAVRVEQVMYGQALAFPPSRDVVAPGTTRGFERIDYIGPDHPPPHAIEETVGLPIDWRYWLTWD